MAPLGIGQAEKRIDVLSSHMRARSVISNGRQFVEIAFEDVLPGCFGTSANGVNGYTAWGLDSLERRFF